MVVGVARTGDGPRTTTDQEDGTLRILAYIATFNDAEVIDACLRGVGEQTRPVDGILIVDNASQDGSADWPLPDGVVRIKNSENLGTSGAAHAAFRYALGHGFDWLWVFDADSVPEPVALQRLIEHLETLSDFDRERTWLLGSVPKEARGGAMHHGVLFHEHGYSPVRPGPDEVVYRCHATMWTGSLYCTAAAQKVGLPNTDYVLDWGDLEYGYVGWRAGYQAYMHQGSIIEHNLHPRDTLRFFKVGKRTSKMFYSPPIRCYYACRNTTYFWLYQYHVRNPIRIAIPKILVRVRYMTKALVLLNSPWPVIWACARGLFDGVFGRLAARF